MPLKKATSKSKKAIQKAVSQNISELAHNGTKQRSQKQIIAIAYNAARGGKPKKKRK